MTLFSHRGWEVGGGVGCSDGCLDGWAHEWKSGILVSTFDRLATADLASRNRWELGAVAGRGRERERSEGWIIDGPTEFGRRGVSGKGSCPADRQAASWWSHLATQSQPEVMGPSLHLQCTVAPRPSQKASGMVVGDGAPSWRVKPSAKSSLSLLLLCAQFAYSTAAFLTFFSLSFPCVTFHSSPSSTYVDGNQPTWGGDERGES